MNETRLLSDHHEIQQLKYRYSYGANILDGKSGDLDMFSALFSEDASFDVGMGEVIGPVQIKALMEQLTTQWHCAMHYMLNPLIDVSGDAATGQFTGLFGFTKTASSAPIWLSNIYTDTFVRTSDGWRFQSVRVRQAFADPAFLEGYADQIK